MNWRRTREGWLCAPYTVKWTNGGKWVARRQADKHSFPEQLGIYQTADEAKQACAEYRERVSV